MQDQRSCVCKLPYRHRCPNHQQEKNMTPIPLLVFHFAHVFGNAKSSVNLITKQNNRVSYKFTNFLHSRELCECNMAVLNFSKKSGRLSSTGCEILTFGSHCSVNFQPILDCFIPKFKLECDDL